MKRDEGEETTAPTLPASRPADGEDERSPADLHALVPELSRLLEQLNETELRTLMLTVSADARTQLPGAGVSLASIALHAADFVVQRNGLDAAFFGRLLTLRPQRRAQIEDLPRAAGVPPPPGGPPPRPPPAWRGRGGVTAALLLGLAGVGVRVWVYPKISPNEPTPTEIPDPPPPNPARADLEMFPAGDDHRPLIRVKLEPADLAALIRPVKRKPAAPQPRPASPATSSTAPPPPPEQTDKRPSTPKVQKDDGDPTTAGAIERRVADLLATEIPLLRFQAAMADPAAGAGVTLWLRRRADDQPWPRGRVELRAELTIDGQAATRPQVLCSFEPSGTRRDQEPLERRFAGCATQVVEQVARWDQHVDALIGRVPFLTRVVVDPRSRYVSTQLFHANLTRAPDLLPGAAYFAVVHDTLGALPFRVCASERIGGYLTSERDLGRECLELHDAAGTYAALPEVRADRIFLTHWRGGQ